MRTFFATLTFCALSLASARLARADGRAKVIDFDSSLVEGINRQPYDSLSQVSDAQKRRHRSHLYLKRSGFSSDTRETLSEMRFAQ